MKRKEMTLSEGKKLLKEKNLIASIPSMREIEAGRTYWIIETRKHIVFYKKDKIGSAINPYTLASIYNPYSI